MISDIRHALRSLGQSAGFTAITLLTLALGIGACTAVFSVVNGVVLRPLAFTEPTRLVAARVVLPAFAKTYPTLPVNARFFDEWRRGCPAFSGLALVDRGLATLTGAGDPVRLPAVRASAGLFTTLGVAPALGRSFRTEEAMAGRSDVVILSDQCWRNHFAADPGIIGRAITLDQRSYTVVGVLPHHFRLPESRQLIIGNGQPNGEPQFYTPKVFSSEELDEVVGRFNYEVIGRLASDVSPSTALMQMNMVAARLTRLAGANLEARGFLASLQESVVAPARQGLFLLLGAITAVLLIACLNLSMLGLARAERRSHSLAVRAALGASRRRLIRVALVESLLLSIGGGVLGCVVAFLGLDFLRGLAPADIPRAEEISVDSTVLVFALCTTVAASVLAGLVPAWRAARTDAAEALRTAGGRTATGGAGPRRVRHLLVAVETGVSTALLAVAALLGTSFVRLVGVDVGFRAPAVLTTEIAIPAARYQTDADRNAFHRRLLSSVSVVPGVAAAAISTALPLEGETWVDSVSVEGDSRPREERPQVNVRFVSSGFFDALGIPLVGGRTFRDADQNRHPIILSSRIAALLFPGQNAVGRRVEHGGESWDVIGVAGDVRANADQLPVPVLYQPYWTWAPSKAALVVRAAIPLAALAPAVRQAIRGVDGDVPVGRFRTMHDILLDSVGQRQFQLRLVAAFALSALALVGLGIYGVTSHSVSQRTRELGIRTAFGARPADIYRLVLRQGFAPIAWGLLAGIGVTLGCGKILAGLLYETDARSPVVLACVVLVLTVVAAFACLIPAGRATKVDPVVALRAE